MQTFTSRRGFMAFSAGVVASAAGLQQAGATPGATRAAPTGPMDEERARLIAEIRSANAEAGAQNAVAEVLRRIATDRDRMVRALGEPSVPGIHPLHRSPTLTVINVVWSPRMVLLPHNHNMWANIAMYAGREDNILWRRQDGAIVAERAASLSERDVFTLPSDAIHSVINPIDRLSGALHVYGGDFFVPAGRSEWDAGTLRERPWSLEGAVRTFKEANTCFEAGRN